MRYFGLDLVLESSSLLFNISQNLLIFLRNIGDQFRADPAALVQRQLPDRLKLSSGLSQDNVFPVFILDKFHRHRAV